MCSTSAARAITKASLNVHCAHDDYHCIDDTGFFQVFGKNAQEAADLNLIARKIAELTLTPAAVGQDGFLTTHLIEPLMVPERALDRRVLRSSGRHHRLPDPGPEVWSMARPAAASRMVWDVDNPVTSGSVQNQDAYMQAVAAQRPYFFDHIEPIADQVMDEYHALTGRRYQRVGGYRTEDADYLILGQGSMITQAEAVADYLRETRKLKVGVVNLTMYPSLPRRSHRADPQGQEGRGRAGAHRSAPGRGSARSCARSARPSPSAWRTAVSRRASPCPIRTTPTYSPGDMPRLYSGCYGLGSRDLQPEGLIAAIENMLPGAAHRKFFYLSIDFMREPPRPQGRDPHPASEGRLSAHRRAGPARQREPQPAAQGRHHGAHALGRRLGRGDDRQEPGDDPL